MARPQRNNVDYFPFLCEEGEKMFYLEETYGNDGFATFVKLLRELAKVDYHYLNLSKPSSMMFLSAKCKVSKEVLNSIITDLVELGKFDRELWEENSVIWCQDFIDSIQDAYSKRSNNCIDRKSLLTLLSSLGVRKPVKRKPKPSLDTLNSDENPQSIVKDTILDETKEEKTKEIEVDSAHSEKPNASEKFLAQKFLEQIGVEKQIAKDFLKNRKAKGLANTETAFRSIVNEINKTGLTPNEIIKICAEKGWGGFKNSWDWKKETDLVDQSNKKRTVLDELKEKMQKKYGTTD